VKAAGFTGLGLAAGLLLGGGSVGAILITDRSAVAAPGPLPAPGASLAPGASAMPGPVTAIVPPAAMSALHQATVLNQRLLADASELERVLKRKSPLAEDIAPILRSLASSAGFGDGLAPAVRSWDAGAAVAKGLAAFYAAVARVADEGLSASLANDRAYADAGRRMRSVLDRITDLDAAARGLAAGAGIELPPLVPAK
jgi:hypothetical protein